VAAAATVPITFVEPDGKEKTVDAKIGMHLLDVAHKNNIDLEGACGGELACSTCHLIFEKEVYDKLPAKLDDEDDMLDMALGLTDT
jgi:ferredoxin